MDDKIINQELSRAMGILPPSLVSKIREEGVPKAKDPRRWVPSQRRASASLEPR